MIKKYIKTSFIGIFFHKRKKYKTKNNCKMNPEISKTGKILFAKIMFL